MDCLEACPVTDKAQQDAIIDAAIKAAYLDPTAPTSLRAIAEMLPGWIKADHKRVGRRLEKLTATGALPQLEKTIGKDGRRRRFRRMYAVAVPEDFTPQVKLIAGDALTQLRLLPEDSIDCCITSPPYYLQGNYCDERQIGQEESPEDYIRRLVQVFAEVGRLLKNHGTCWVNIAETQRDGDSLLIPHRLAIALQESGWLIRSEIVIERVNSAPYSNLLYRRTHEVLLLLAQSKAHYFCPTERTTVWQIAHVLRNVGNHPCPMPVSLAKECIITGSPPGGTVLDPFLGSGTTAIAAIEARRHAIGIELSDYYLSFVRKQLRHSCLPDLVRASCR
jgi:DNA modification methylase